MTKYVLGFAFNRQRDRVGLIEKNRPDWQLGKLNGIGGHIEQFDTTPHDAMQREFSEEAGVLLGTWTHYATMRSLSGWRVHVFYAHNVELHAMREGTDERLLICDPWNLPPNALPNLRWLIPLALDPDKPILTTVAYP